MQARFYVKVGAGGPGSISQGAVRIESDGALGTKVGQGHVAVD